MLLCFHLEEAGATLRRRAKFTLAIENRYLPPNSRVCAERGPVLFSLSSKYPACMTVIRIAQAQRGQAVGHRSSAQMGPTSSYTRDRPCSPRVPFWAVGSEMPHGYLGAWVARPRLP